MPGFRASTIRGKHCRMSENGHDSQEITHAVIEPIKIATRSCEWTQAPPG